MPWNNQTFMLSLNTLNVILLPVCKCEAQRCSFKCSKFLPFYLWVLNVDLTQALIHEPITLGEGSVCEFRAFPVTLKPQDGAFVRRWCPCTIYFIPYERSRKLRPTFVSGFFLLFAILLFSFKFH